MASFEKSHSTSSSLSSKLIDSMKRERLPGNTFKGSVLLFCNGLIGAGAVSLPHAMNEMGLINGFVFIGIIALGSIFSSWMLVECADHTGSETYLTLASVVGGPRMRVLGLCCLSIFCFGTSCAFLSIVMTSMPAVFKSVLCQTRDWTQDCDGTGVIDSVLLEADSWLVLYASIVVCPLLMLASNSEKFKVAQSATALLGNSYLILITCGRFYFGHYKINFSQILHNMTTDHLNLARPNARALLSASIVMQCFSTQWIIFPLYHSLQRSSAERFVRVSKFSILLAFALYEGVAILGYLTWLDQVSPNVLENYSHRDTAMNFARVALTISVTTGTILNLGSVADLLIEELIPKSLLKVSQVALLALALAVALWVPGVDIIFAVTGSIAGSAINFILPSIFLIHLRLGTANMRFAAYVLLGIGVSIGIGGPATIAYAALP